MQTITLAELAKILTDGKPWPFEGQFVAVEDVAAVADADGCYVLENGECITAGPCPHSPRK